jgi:hypothetical protein
MASGIAVDAGYRATRRIGQPKDADLQKYIDALQSKVEILQNANAL